MKRFISILLVAMLIVASLATVAFAAGNATVKGSTKTAEPGDEVKLTFTVSGEFANYELVLSTNSPLSITGISGIEGNLNTGKVAWAAAENVSSHSFTVTVKVAEDAKPGSYPVDAKVLFVSNRNLEVQTTSVTPGYVVIEEPACVHDWQLVDSKASTCTEQGYENYKCSKCGETKTVILELAPHTFGKDWKHNTKQHWHECSVCGEKCEHLGDHGDWDTEVIEEATTEKDGKKKITCGTCGWFYYEKIDKDKDPGGPATGDITPVIALSVTSLITLAGTSLYVFKRKNAK